MIPISTAPLLDIQDWPWRGEIPSRAPANDASWPKITIVTPSYNQGQYLEATIRSVLLQAYPNLEYMIIDGGSSDQSLEIIKKYEPWLSYWESTPDRGQSHAINKGFARASGDVLGWINSDDMYLPGSLLQVGRTFSQTQCEVLSGNTVYLEVDQFSQVKTPVKLPVAKMLKEYLSSAPQPSTFWRRACWMRYGPLDEQLHYRMDYALFLCFAGAGLDWKICPDNLAIFRRYEGQKTWTWQDATFHGERVRAIQRFASYDDFGTRYAAEIQRGLWFEGWLKSWLATQVMPLSASRRAIKIWTAPIYNWRSLFIPAYYRRILGVLTGVIKPILGL